MAVIFAIWVQLLIILTKDFQAIKQITKEVKNKVFFINTF
jgi:hypothetical protein